MSKHHDSLLFMVLYREALDRLCVHLNMYLVLYIFIFIHHNEKHRNNLTIFFIELDLRAVVYKSVLVVSLRVSAMLYGIPSTRHEWTHPALTPARHAGTWFSNPRRMEGWVDLGDWLYHYIPRWFTNTIDPPTHTSSLVTRPGVEQLRINCRQCAITPHCHPSVSVTVTECHSTCVF